MLNIPYEVKQALRKGCYKKNYKMKVNDVVDVDIYNTLEMLSCDAVRGKFTISETGKYRFYNPDYNTGIYIRLVTPGVGEVDIADIEASGEDNTEICLTLEATQNDDYYRIYPFNWELPDDEFIQLQQYITTEQQRVYAYTIDNDTLIKESVKIDERMVTGKQLKFGLCEGSLLEFQYFGHPNINGKDVQVYCSVEYVDGNGDVAWYDIPMGWYTVDQCPRQWNTGIYKVTAYNKLKSDYLDANANKKIIDIVTEGEIGRPSNTVSLQTILDRMLKGYSIYEKSGISQNLVHAEMYEGLDAFCCTRLNDLKKSSGHFLKIITYSVPMTVEGQLDPNEYYRLVIKCSALDSIFEQFRENYIRDENSNLYDFYDGDLGTGTATQYSDYYSMKQTLYHERIMLSRDYPASYSVILNRNKDEYTTEWLTGLTNEDYWNFTFPLIYEDTTSFNRNIDSRDEQNINRIYAEIKNEIFDNIIVLKRDLTDIEKEIYTLNDVKTWPDVTLRDLQSATYELSTQYGKLDRITDLFSGVELNQGGLYPADTLYPDNALYPSGNMEHPFPSTYSKLWTDTVGEQSFRYLIITYKGTETVDGQTQEVEKKLQRTVNTNGTTDYNMSDNWFFRNLVWTDEDVGDYADAMVEKMRDIRWFPFEMWAVGMPYIETGDAIEITDKQGNTHTSYVLTRTLNGIQNLQDTFVNGELDIF